MTTMILRFAIVWTSLHIILFFIEMYRYKHSRLSWYGFKNNAMLDITDIILFVDKLGVIAAMITGLGYWIFQPIIK